jgi:hypothetical protein
MKKLFFYLEKALFPIPTRPGIFNQYKDRLEGLDLPDAPRMRRENLRNYLESFSEGPSYVLVGEAAGPWGARFSGVAFTSERQLARGLLPFKGERTSTHEPPYLEYSGNIIWKTLLPHFPDFFLWNAVPLLVHKPEKPLSIRTPEKEELEEFSPILKQVLSILKPRTVVAVGKSAQFALNLLKIKNVYVRHPSQHGVNEFREEIEKIFKI